MLERLLRRLTDFPVWCERCGQPVGWMARGGPRRWGHVECPGYAEVEVAE